MPISKTQLGKLGDRLRDSPTPDPADLALFERVLEAYGEALRDVTARLRRLGHVPIGRLKVTGTVVQKLRRNRTFRLDAIQDLAGARVVVQGDLDQQDSAVDRFRATCSIEGRVPVVIDRRADPRAGYRAVHTVVRIDGLPVEVQFRTTLQNRWAQIFERLAGEWGRQIRYGGELAPDSLRPERVAERQEIIVLMMNLSTNIARYEELSCSDVIKQLEAEVAELRLDFAAPEEALPVYQRRVRANYVAYRAAFYEAGNRLQSRLDELADRVESEGKAK